MRCEWNNCFSNVQTNITLAFSSPYSSTITTSATSDAIHFGDEVRRKFESTTQCCRIRDKLAKDTIATHSRKFATECKPYRCQWVEFRRQDDCFCAKKMQFQTITYESRSDAPLSTFKPRLNSEATALGLICIFPFSGRRGEGARALRSQMNPNFKPRYLRNGWTDYGT